MKILKVELESLRTERRRSTKFTLLFFTFLAMTWPLFLVEVVKQDAPVMEDITFESYSTTVHVSKSGSVKVTEVVEVDFATEQTYIRSVGELAANSSKARYFSKPLEAKIDGKTVGIDESFEGIGGHFYSIGEPMKGKHEVEFSYEVPNGIIYQKGVPTYRSRLLPRYSFSEVKNFKAVLIFDPAIITDEAVCWTTDGDKPENKQDRCDFAQLDEHNVRIEIAEPAYLRPVRLVVPLEDGEYSTDSLPWSGYWDNVLGRHWFTPLLTLLTAVLLAWALLRFAAPRFNDRRWQQIVAGMFLGTVGALTFVSFTPSILILLPTAILWAGMPAWLRSSENRMILTEEQVQTLQAAAQADKDAASESEENANG